jgi:hypothetical protein
MRLPIVFFTLMMAACFKPSFESGHLRCSTNGKCPPGLSCSTVDNHCYSPGMGPTLSDGGSDLASSDGKQATVPDAPTSVVASSGVASATVSWTAPASNGGSPILSYTVTSSPGGVTATTSDGATTMAMVSGLTNDTTYTFVVTATNAIGTSAPSASSNAVTPTATPQAPDAPTGVTAVVTAPKAITVSWSVPDNHGSAITHYTVTSSPADSTTNTPDGTTSMATFTGLTVGNSYTYSVTATNSVGTSAASAPSSSVTVLDVPQAPVGVAACGQDSQVRLTFQWAATASSFNAYYSTSPGVTTSTGTKYAGTVSPSPVALTVPGLTNGTPYYFVVTTVNAAGESSGSAPVVSATPAPAVHDALFFSSTVSGADAIGVIDCYSAVANNAQPPPVRMFTVPLGAEALFVDAANATLYAYDDNNFATNVGISVYSNVTRLEGPATPTRRLHGPSTTLGDVSNALFVDTRSNRDRLYIDDGQNSRILIFANASTLNNDQAPAASVALPDPTNFGAFAYNTSNDDLYVTNAGAVSVFASANTLAGSISSPTRSISINSVSGGQTAITYDSSTSTLYVVSCGDGVTCMNTTYIQAGLYSIPNPGTAGSSVTTTTALALINAWYIQAVNNVLYVGSGSQNTGTFRQWGSLTTATGSAAPTKTTDMSGYTNGSIFYVP